MPLTDLKIRTVKPLAKTTRLFDGHGLYLEVTPKGNKWWRLKYRFGGKEKRISMGVYPLVSLKDARNKSFEARKQLDSGIDPSAARKAEKNNQSPIVTNSFESIARSWFAKFSRTWSEGHGARILRRFERDIFPWIGKESIASITPPELLKVLQRIENRGALETAHRALQNCSKVYRYAIASGLATENITDNLRDAIPPPMKKHFASITDPKKVGALLRSINGYEGTLITKYALQLAPLFFVRPSELRYAEWVEFDFDINEWHIPAQKMKMRTQHIVPLSTQATAILTELHKLTGQGKYLLPSVRSPDRPMSDNTLNAALRRLGYTSDEMTGHGFRAMARTILDEVLGIRPDFVEHQLAHAVRDPNGRAYNRTAHLDERKKMMQIWADYLDGLAVTDKAVSLKNK